MIIKLRIPLALVAILLLISPGLAQGTVLAQSQGPDHNDPTWQVEYWDNMGLNGSPVAHDTHAKIDWDWGTGSPHPDVEADRFSVRWTRYLDTESGTFRFTATSDDGIRVFVDGRATIDEWTDHAAQTFFREIQLTAGHHLVVVEYYENLGVAVAKVSWEATGSEIRPASILAIAGRVGSRCWYATMKPSTLTGALAHWQPGCPPTAFPPAGPALLT